MIKALAPTMPRGCSWVWLAIVLVLVQAGPLARPVGAQPRKDSPATTKKGATAPKPGEEPDAEAPAEKAAPAEKPNAQAEVFRDPNALKVLENTYPTLYRTCSRNDIRAVQAMAGGQIAIDRETIVRFVEGMAHELTDKTNLKALLDPESGIPPGSMATHALQDAVDELLDMMQRARSTNNQGFLNTYSRVLAEKLKAVLNGNLLSRLEAMIVLAQTNDASPEMIDLFIKQLNDPKQTVWVKHWAMRGLTNSAPTLANNAGAAMSAAKAVADVLEQEKDLPWPVQYRGLEALGALRQASTARPPKGQPEMASTAMRFLADPEARPEVRAEAGWALGMMQVSGSIGKFNFPLVTYNVGDLAASLGESINDAFAKNPSRSEYYTGLLVNQVYQALEGLPTVRDSGLVHGTHPNLASHRNYIKQVSDLVKPITKASIELVRSTRGQVPKAQKTLGDSVAALKGFLDKNQPANSWLVPGGQEFPMKGANAVAGTAAEARVTGTPGR